MEFLSIRSTSFIRHFLSKVIVVSVIVTIYFDYVYCASTYNRANRSVHNGSETILLNGESSFSHRQLPAGGMNPNIHPNNFYLNTPASLGFPYYQTPGTFHVPFNVFQQPTTSAQIPVMTTDGATKLKLSDKLTNDMDHLNGTAKTEKLQKVKKNKPVLGERNSKKVEGKTDDGTGRGCPACVSGTCDPTFDPNVNVSGIPVIQIIFGLFAGIFWAGVFLFILKNFIEPKSSDSGGYGSAPAPMYGTPQYGAPQQDYGAPSAGYNTNRIAYTNGYGRSSEGFTFNELSSWVWDTIDKLTKVYEA